MNLTDLIKEVNKDLDDSLSNADITGWINRALDDLSKVARYKKEATINVVADQKSYTLPTDLIQIVYLLDGDTELQEIPMRDFTSIGYKKWNGLILQPTPTESKTLDLYYYATLPHLISPEDIPAIRSDYHDLIVLYATAKARYQDEEELYQSIVWNEYQLRKQEFAGDNYGETYTISEVY